MKAKGGEHGQMTMSQLVLTNQCIVDIVQAYRSEPVEACRHLVAEAYGQQSMLDFDEITDFNVCVLMLNWDQLPPPRQAPPPRFQFVKDIDANVYREDWQKDTDLAGFMKWEIKTTDQWRKLAGCPHATAKAAAARQKRRC